MIVRLDFVEGNVRALIVRPLQDEGGVAQFSPLAYMAKWLENNGFSWITGTNGIWAQEGETWPSSS